ncbi:MAG: hypothetical protein ACK4V6_20215 [Microthrixaceae bacterium]
MRLRHRTAVAAALLLPLLAAACSAPPDLTGSGNSSDPALLQPGATPPPSARPIPPRTSGFPGDVAAGSLRWGAAIGGNSDPARHESVAGAPMGLRRTFFQWKQRSGSLVSTAKADLAAGRLPWVSVKPPSWAAVAAGAHDAEIDEMLRGLDALAGPVWLTVHHEPEGGGGVNAADDPGGPTAWRGMQQRFRSRMSALGTDNIALAPILMAWTYDSRSGRNPSDWWVDGIWDFVGIDHYQDSLSAPSVLNTTWSRMYAFVSAKGMKIAIGEWGNRGTDATSAAEMRAFYDFAVASGRSGGSQVIGLSYFDSNLNSPSGGWELFGQPLATFRELIKGSGSVGVRSAG